MESLNGNLAVKQRNSEPQNFGHQMMNAIAQMAEACKRMRDCTFCPCYNYRTDECVVMNLDEEPKEWVDVIDSLPLPEEEEDDNE